ncbi:uncharacterized protein LOC112349159 [Selaginella moellendorffii]|uniref:uncharacterized protein LOC112349159 n=1 Tax=Selaginella moellendorffii TaxID=88036 RepID=UPI000D1D08E4|nr:uncharacterized protein LOC112349159 [Selaginella moellendorffii]XP_024538772.1 uncharacterized protein LOC112349159 [Selaginella moellendorffii]XP_024538773.1 uncharacterized protein LOC112349159 [Selaginella moellendorffii]|eukprot:XP_024538771.1 uncharacterized protein LOC112349159 [Selaginella moellendorffii]
MCRYVASAMESTAAGAATTSRKLKREAAQRRKAQARSLKLRAEEQERLQRLEIDALVEQQRVQRLERHRRKEDAEKLAREASGLGLSNSCCSQGGAQQTRSSDARQQQQQSGTGESRSSSSSSSSAVPSWPVVYKDHQQATAQDAAEQPATSQQVQQARALVDNRRKLARGPRSGNGTVGLALTQVTNFAASKSSDLALEDHRVVSTEYQAAGTQALMRVTLLAAGFVIGARGISARLIGQVTGAIIQSWTESSACRHSNSATGVPMRLFRIQGKKAVVQAAVALVEQAVAKYRELCECKRRGEFVQREHVINGVEFYYQPPPRKAFSDQLASSRTPSSSSSPSPASVAAAATSTSNCNSGSRADVPFPPHHAWLRHLQAAGASSRDGREAQPDGHGRAKQVASHASQHSLQVESSLFSVFGNGGLPLPLSIAQESAPSLKTSSLDVSTTPFDFPKYDFFREILPALPQQQQGGEHNLFGDELCMLCVERPRARGGATRLTDCGHASFCSSCVRARGHCPVCHAKLVGWGLM